MRTLPRLSDLRLIVVDKITRSLPPAPFLPAVPNEANLRTHQVTADTVTDTQPRPRPGGKLGLVLDLLEQSGGATIDDLVAATGWLPHTVRAAISDLRKRGFLVHMKRWDGVSHYSIVSKAET